MGKVDTANPVTYALPAASTAMARAAASSRKVEYTNWSPVGLSLVTKLPPALSVVSKAPGVTGKSVAPVDPVTYALPVASTAMP